MITHFTEKEWEKFRNGAAARAGLVEVGSGVADGVVQGAGEPMKGLCEVFVSW